MTVSASPLSLSPRVLQFALLNAVGSLILLVGFAMNGIGTVTAEGCTRQVIDFHVFWSAARLALEGTPLAALNPAILQTGFNACNSGWLPWLHPPAALAMMTPFGLLPLVPAWVAFNVVSLATLAVSLRPFTQGSTALLVAFATPPALLPALLAGQFVTLWMAGLLAALWAMRTGRWALAGVFIGALTLKPTLGLMVPFALLALGAWRTISAAIVTAVVLHGTATLIYGPEYWSLLVELYGQHSANGVAQLGTVSTMTSLAGFLAAFNVPGGLALKANLIAAGLLAIIVFLVWRWQKGPTDIASAVLVASIPLATPYLWHYDSAFLALSALFLARHVGFAPRPILAVVLVALWIGGGFSLWLAATGLVASAAFNLTVPPLLLLAFLVSLAHSRAEPKEGR